MDEVELGPDDFGEGVLGLVPGVAREQFQIGVAHVQKDNVAGRGNPPRNLTLGAGWRKGDTPKVIALAKSARKSQALPGRSTGGNCFGEATGATADPNGGVWDKKSTLHPICGPCAATGH